METSELIKKVRALEVKTKMITRDLFQGDYHSAFKGRGMSFSEVREYSYGDDIRNIDWNVTARTSTPYVKVFEEERELTLMLMLDVSASMNFGSHQQHKKDLILELSAVLAFSAIGNNDKVGALFFSDKVEKYIAPKKGKQNILFILREIIQFNSTLEKTDFTPALQYLNGIQKKKCICFLLSDFQGKNFTRDLAVIAKKHDMVGIKVSDPLEIELPRAGIIPVRDNESQKIMYLDSGSARVRNLYREKAEEKIQMLRNSFAEARADLILLKTGEDYYKVLHAFFKKRSGK